MTHDDDRDTIARAAAALDDPDMRREAPAPRAVDPLREALVEVIELAMGSDDEWSPEMRQEATHIADALLADGWCKPGAVVPVETLAWAVVDEDGAIIPYLTDFDKERAQRWASIEKGNLVRVAIRIVEDEA